MNFELKLLALDAAAAHKCDVLLVLLPEAYTGGAGPFASWLGQMGMTTLLVERGYSVSQSLLYTMIMNIGSLLGATTAALIANRVGRRTAVTAAGVLGCLTALAFAATRTQSSRYPYFAPAVRFAATLPGST